MENPSACTQGAQTYFRVLLASGSTIDACVPLLSTQVLGHDCPCLYLPKFANIQQEVVFEIHFFYGTGCVLPNISAGVPIGSHLGSACDQDQVTVCDDKLDLKRPTPQPPTTPYPIHENPIL